MGRVAGKVVLVTGAARGQGRSHAVRLAEEGADVIAFDVCADIGTNEYPLATEADLDETARLVEKAGGRIVAAEVDVRDRAALEVCLADAVAHLPSLRVSMNVMAPRNSPRPSTKHWRFISGLRRIHWR